MKPEILAPVGSFEALHAAVENGADAVYLGGKLFNARQQAANFDEEELKRAREYTAGKGVKIFVTVNTLLADSELAEAADYLNFLYTIGVDAVIVQDLGIGKMVRSLFPAWELHGSTQMTVHSLAGLKLMEELGYDRIILARELTLEEIAMIASNTSLQIEVFVHGALCICYSGQCLMSSMIGGRSGNRGRCAQPCRLKYQLVSQDGKRVFSDYSIGEHLLSPKDLKTVENLPALVRAGVSSFKIEGRMKRPEYVATVVRVYRDALDRYLDAPDNFRVYPEEEKRLWQIFNRDFTPGHMFGVRGRELMSFQRPNNRGIRLGRVLSYRPKDQIVTIKLEDRLRRGDGIEVWVSQGGRTGSTVEQIRKDGKQVDEASKGDTIEVKIDGKIRPGDRVFKTYDADLMEEAINSFASLKGQAVPIGMEIAIENDRPITLKAWDHEGHLAVVVGDFKVTEAINRPITEDVIREKLGRLGNTPYFLEKLVTRMDSNLMVPMSELNELRRRVVEELTLQREKFFAWHQRGGVDQQALEHLFQRSPRPKGRTVPLLTVKVADNHSVREALEAGADAVILSGEFFRSKGKFDYWEAINDCHQAGKKVYMASPRIARGTLEGFLKWVKEAEKIAPDALHIGNLGHLWACRHTAELPIFSDFPLNPFNALTMGLLKNLGVQRITLSPELNLRQIRELFDWYPWEIECIIHGRIPLMVSEYCPINGVRGEGGERRGSCSHLCQHRNYGLRDQKGYIFPVEVDTQCRMHLLNGVELCMAGNIGELYELGISSLRLELSTEKPEKVRDITRLYRYIINDIIRGREPDSNEVQQIIEEVCPCGITKGHYFRGVI